MRISVVREKLFWMKTTIIELSFLKNTNWFFFVAPQTKAFPTNVIYIIASFDMLFHWRRAWRGWELTVLLSLNNCFPSLWKSYRFIAVPCSVLTDTTFRLKKASFLTCQVIVSLIIYAILWQCGQGMIWWRIFDLFFLKRSSSLQYKEAVSNFSEILFVCVYVY